MPTCNAQLAASRVGATRLAELFERHGRDGHDAARSTTFSPTASGSVRTQLEALPDGVYQATTEVEGDGVTTDDIPIRCSADDRRRPDPLRLHGHCDAVAGNVNCPRAVTRSACLFALRVLLPADVPDQRGHRARYSS